MKRLTVFLFISLLAFATMGFARDAAEVNWDAFSKNLAVALASGNEGLQQSAISHVIEYCENLEMNDAAVDLVRIYRNNKDERMRQMAVVVLHKVNNKWAMDFLFRNYKFENNPTIKRMIADCFYQQQQKLLAIQLNEQKKLIAESTK
ncbi:MAG: hypothetical protein WAN36_15535 [Calditrichia bacterium]